MKVLCVGKVVGCVGGFVGVGIGEIEVVVEQCYVVGCCGQVFGEIGGGDECGVMSVWYDGFLECKWFDILSLNKKRWVEVCFFVCWWLGGGNVLFLLLEVVEVVVQEFVEVLYFVFYWVLVWVDL